METIISKQVSRLLNKASLFARERVHAAIAPSFRPAIEASPKVSSEASPQQFQPIPQDAVLFQNHEVCIVKPNTPGSVLVVHHCHSDVFEAILSDGLKSRGQLAEEGVLTLHSVELIQQSDAFIKSSVAMADSSNAKFDFGYVWSNYRNVRIPPLLYNVPPDLTDYNENIFFRAFKFPMTLGSNAFYEKYKEHPSDWVAISVDPSKTFVYCSTARGNNDNTTYTESQILLSSLMQGAISRASEVLVKLPVLQPDWFADTSLAFATRLQNDEQKSEDNSFRV